MVERMVGLGARRNEVIIIHWRFDDGGRRLRMRRPKSSV